VTVDDVVGLILSVVILAYLVYALVFPERLG
jgi:K+-transporting ATPase KdpF subunit